MKPSLAKSFDTDASGYDAYRPGYPEQLIQALLDYAKLEPDSRCLEIGAGTGQATQAMLVRGLCVEALEPGEQLAAELIIKLGHFPKLSVNHSNFEDFESPEGVFDLIYSASAFHWLPKGVAYHKALKLLKPGGTLGLFWLSFSVNRPDDQNHQALQAVFERFGFGMTELSHDPERYLRKQNSLRKRGFSEVSVKIFQSEHLYTSDQFLGLLSTTSRFRTLTAEEQGKLMGAIRQVLEKVDGVWLDQTCDLYLGRRPAKHLARDKI